MPWRWQVQTDADPKAHKLLRNATEAPPASRGTGDGDAAALLTSRTDHALCFAAFEGAPEEIDVTVFPANGEAAASAERGAKALVAQAHQARQFTDTASFTLRCSELPCAYPIAHGVPLAGDIHVLHRD